MDRRIGRNCILAGKKRMLGSSVLGAFAAILLITSGFFSVCAQAKTTTPTTKVIKTTNEDDFAAETSKLVKKNKGRINTKGQAVEYSSCRLIVRVKDGKKANLTSYGASTVIQSNFGVNIVQFSSSSAAKNAAKKIAKLSAVSYAEADDVSLDVGDKTSQISFEGASESDDLSGNGVTGTDNLSFQENPAFTGNTDPTASGYDRSQAGKDTTYDATIESGATAVSSTAMSWGKSYLRCDKYAHYVRNKTSRTIKVAIVDSGVSYHTKLKGRILAGMDFVDNDKNAADENGHGTHVAGTVVDCTPGLKVYILPVRVMDGSGMGNPSVVGNGIRYAVARGAKVINLSLGGDSHYSYLEECITYAHKKGVTVVIAAGNENENTKYTCPAHMSAPIVVSAIDSDGERAYFSNYGSSIDVAAPGINIVSCGLDGGYANASGTSMAAPHVSAVAAMYRLLRPTATPAKIQSLVKYYARDYGATGVDSYYGAGVPRLTDGIFPAKVTLSKTSLSLQLKKTYTLKATITPSYAGAKRSVAWRSSNSKVVSVSGGKLTARAKGTAVITVRTANNKTAKCKVTVTAVNASSVTLNVTSKTLKEGNTLKLTATVLPTTAENKNVTWTSSNSKVATVSSGKVTAKNAGTARITAKTSNGLTKTCTVKVTAAAVSASSVGTPKAVTPTSASSSGSGASTSGNTVTASDGDEKAQQTASAAAEEETAQENPAAASEEETAQENPAAAPEEETAQEDLAAASEEEAAHEDPLAAAEEEAAQENPAAAPEEETAQEDPLAAAEEEAAQEDPLAAAEEEAAQEDLAAASEEEAAQEDPFAVTEEEAAQEDPLAIAEEEAAQEDPFAVTEEGADQEESSDGAQEEEIYDQEAPDSVSDEQIYDQDNQILTTGREYDFVNEEQSADQNQENVDGDQSGCTEQPESVDQILNPEEATISSDGELPDGDNSLEAELQETAQENPVDGEEQETAQENPVDGEEQETAQENPVDGETQETPLSETGKDFLFPFLDAILP